MAFRKLPDGRWIVYYYEPRPDGKRKKIREYFNRGPEGEAAAKQRDAELGLRKTSPRKSRSGPAFAELAMAYVKFRGFNENSEKHVKIRLQANILPQLGHRPAVMLDDNDMDLYVKRRRREGVKDSTIRRELTDIKAIMNWAAKRRPPIIPFNPVRDYKKPTEDDDIIMPPTDDEISALFDTFSHIQNAHVNRFVTLCCYLGARPGYKEILSIRWGQISWQGQSVRVLSAEKGGPRSRQVPIHDAFVATIKSWWNEDRKKHGESKAKNLTIVHYFGRPIKSIKKAWNNALTNAGIKRRIRPYDLRHRFVTLALEEGADIKALSEIVGSRPETLQRHYQHVTREIHRQTINRLPVLNPQRGTKGPEITI